MVALDPEERVGVKIVGDLGPAVIVDQRVPVLMEALTRILMLVERRPVIAADAVRIADPATGPAWSARLGVASVGTQAMLDDADVVLLAVKPQVLAEVVAPLRFRPDQLVVSVVAGLSLSRVQGLCSPARVVRVMPNVACQVRAGATLLLTAGAAAEDVRQVAALFEAVGHVERLADERLFHAGTSVSGSGPAWIFMAMEALADGAVAAGLPRAAALRMKSRYASGERPVAAAKLRMKWPGPL